jgi:hypothetical protein
VRALQRVSIGGPIVTELFDLIFRLILYLPKLALHGGEVFELLSFSCGLDNSSSSSSASGCVEALFYIALNLQPSQIPLLRGCPVVDVSLSVDHNAVALLRSAASA